MASNQYSVTLSQSLRTALDGEVRTRITFLEIFCRYYGESADLSALFTRVDCIVQMFFAYRINVLSGSRMVALPICLVVLSYAQFTLV